MEKILKIRSRSQNFQFWRLEIISLWFLDTIFIFLVYPIIPPPMCHVDKVVFFKLKWTNTHWVLEIETLLTLSWAKPHSLGVIKLELGMTVRGMQTYKTSIIYVTLKIHKCILTKQLLLLSHLKGSKLPQMSALPNLLHHTNFPKGLGLCVSLCAVMKLKIKQKVTRLAWRNHSTLIYKTKMIIS